MAVRVIAGEARGRRLAVPKGQTVRPTSGLVRGALCNMLVARGLLEGARILDCFAGSGALGIEALSRGAREAIFVEAAPAAARRLRANLQASGVGERARVVPLDVRRALRLLAHEGTLVDGVLADPPYHSGWAHRILAVVAASGILAAHGWVALEHAADEVVSPPEGFERAAARRHGRTAIQLFCRIEEPA